MEKLLLGLPTSTRDLAETAVTRWLQDGPTRFVDVRLSVLVGKFVGIGANAKNGLT
jgi:hypothetical protein